MTPIGSFPPPDDAADSDAPRSLVAGANALFRMAESKRPPSERVLFDPYAAWFAELDPRILAIRYGRFALPPLWSMIDALQTVHCVRHASVDALVREALRPGQASASSPAFRQVVIVGAGYDMRAYRFAGEGAPPAENKATPDSPSMRSVDGSAPDVRWFEADLPATAARKWRILERRGEARRLVAHVGVDLERESLAAALRRTDFDFEAPAVFVLEGLIHYLSPERLRAVLADLAAGTGGRRVILSFIRSEMYEGAPGLFVRLVKAVHEIPRLHFSPDGLAALLAEHGFGAFRSWRIEEQIEAFAKNARGRRYGVSQDVAWAERAG